MKFVNIKPIDPSTTDEHSFVNILLANGVVSDSLYGKIVFDVELMENDPIDFMYRRMYERLFYPACVSPNESHIHVSLSELIQYLYVITPPILKSKISETLKSVDSIIDSVKQFLNDNGGYQLSYFRDTIKMAPYVTNWTIDTEKIDFVSNSITSGDITTLMMCEHQVSAMFMSDETQSFSNVNIPDASIMCCTKFATVDQYLKTYKEISPFIDNIKIDDNGIYVSFYKTGVAENFPYHLLFETYNRIESYEG